ncbi:MAG: nuclear transport factor 2 family protein [Clostridiales bacterium]|nr:nuclear transport factor 2 family protein [Clostridiales bacterium]
MSDEEQIRQLYIDYWKYMIAKNADGLRSIMSDDYYLLHMTGTKQYAEVFLKGLLDGTFNYYSAEHDEIIVDVDSSGVTATMIGRSRVLAAVYGGGKNMWRLRGDFTLRKEADVWKLTSSKASTY